MSARDSLIASVCPCGYDHQDYCGGDLCDECSSCGSLVGCDECATEEREQDLARDERLAEEDAMLYGI